MTENGAKISDLPRKGLCHGFPSFIHEGELQAPCMSNTTTVEQPDPFAEEEVATLIEWLDLGEGEEWQAAARSLYVRYYEKLFRCLYKPLRESGGIEDIVIKTFNKAIRNIFKFKRVEGEDPDDTRARFEAWLLKIARRLVLDQFRKAPPTETRDDEFWEYVTADAARPTEEVPSSTDVDVVRDVLSEFPERDQIILRAWLQHSPEFTNPQSKLPRDVLQDLSESLNTTKANIRQIKSRALVRFKALLSEKGIQI